MIALMIHKVDHVVITESVSWRHGTFEIRKNDTTNPVDRRICTSISSRLSNYALLALCVCRAIDTGLICQ